MKKLLWIIMTMTLLVVISCKKHTGPSIGRTEKPTETTAETSVSTESESNDPIENIYTYEETSLEASQYYEENSKIISISPFSDSSDAIDGATAVELLHEKGFYQYDVISDYVEEGDDDEVIMTETTTDKYPIYETYYITEAGDYWTIFVINGKIMASPVSYNINSSLPVQVIISEAESVVSFDYTSKTYYETIPDKSALIVKVIPAINAEALEKLTFEEIDAL